MSQPYLAIMAADVVRAMIANNQVTDPKQVPLLLEGIGAALQKLHGGVSPEKPLSVARDRRTAAETGQQPAVPIRESIHPEYVVCLEDGKQMKMLKRYLVRVHHMSPEEYRLKWGLPAEYPLIAPNYAKAKSRCAKRMGLGTHTMRQAVAARRHQNAA